MPLEANFVGRALKYLRSEGFFAEKNHGNEYTRKGLHDIQACGIGYYLGVEAKRDWHAQMEPAQLQVQKEVRAAGGIHICTWRMEDLTEVVRLCRQGRPAWSINALIDQAQITFRNEHGRRRRILPDTEMAGEPRAPREISPSLSRTLELFK